MKGRYTNGFSEKLKMLLKSHELSQERVAELCHLICQAVSRWEPEIAFSDIYNLITLSEIFHVIVHYLVKDST